MNWSWQKNYSRQTAEIVAFSKLVYERKLVSAAGGNVSVRCGDFLLITASGDSLRDASEDSLLLCDLEGRVVEGEDTRKPSKETPFHAAVYRSRPEINCIIHAHPVYSTIASSAFQTLPLYTDSARLKLVEVPVVPEALPGSPELAAHVLRAVSVSHPKAVSYLLADHGILVLGSSMGTCFDTAELVEDTAQIAVFRQLLNFAGFLNR